MSYIIHHTSYYIHHTLYGIAHQLTPWDKAFSPGLLRGSAPAPWRYDPVSRRPRRVARCACRATRKSQTTPAKTSFHSSRDCHTRTLRAPLLKPSLTLNEIPKRNNTWQTMQAVSITNGRTGYRLLAPQFETSPYRKSPENTREAACESSRTAALLRRNATTNEQANTIQEFFWGCKAWQTKHGAGGAVLRTTVDGPLQ